MICFWRIGGQDREICAAVSDQQSAISYQLSAISCQLTISSVRNLKKYSVINILWSIFDKEKVARTRCFLLSFEYLLFFIANDIDLEIRQNASQLSSDC